MREEKIDALQGLRGFAILMIALSHCGRLVDGSGQQLFGNTGSAGVSLFILLSGYLAVLRHTRHRIADRKEQLCFRWRMCRSECSSTSGDAQYKKGTA